MLQRWRFGGEEEGGCWQGRIKWTHTDPSSSAAWLNVRKHGLRLYRRTASAGGFALPPYLPVSVMQNISVVCPSTRDELGSACGQLVMPHTQESPRQIYDNTQQTRPWGYSFFSLRFVSQSMFKGYAKPPSTCLYVPVLVSLGRPRCPHCRYLTLSWWCLSVCVPCASRCLCCPAMEKTMHARIACLP